MSDDWPGYYVTTDVHDYLRGYTALCRQGYPEDLHTYGPKGSTQYRICTRCLHRRPPVLESITCHPFDRPRLDEQIPTARVFGEPLPDGTLILESIGVQLGTLRLCIEGQDMEVTFPWPYEPQRWVRCGSLADQPPRMVRIP